MHAVHTTSVTYSYKKKKTCMEIWQLPISIHLDYSLFDDKAELYQPLLVFAWTESLCVLDLCSQSWNIASMGTSWTSHTEDRFNLTFPFGVPFKPVMVYVSKQKNILPHIHCKPNSTTDERVQLRYFTLYILSRLICASYSFSIRY